MENYAFFYNIIYIVLLLLYDLRNCHFSSWKIYSYE